MYAIEWSPEDVRTLRPEWSKLEAEEWLDGNWKHIRDRSVERGWEAMRELLDDEGEGGLSHECNVE